MNKINVKSMTQIAMVTALICVCSWITIPSVVPFTLQTFGVFVALELLGGIKGTIAIALYILLGAIGLPVFSNFQGGISKLLSSTGGCIVGFLVTGIIYIVLTKINKESAPLRIAAMILGLAGVYTLGTLWFIRVYSAANGSVSLQTVLGWCVYPFIIPDLIKLGLAYVIGGRVKKALNIKNEA